MPTLNPPAPLERPAPSFVRRNWKAIAFGAGVALWFACPLLPPQAQGPCRLASQVAMGTLPGDTFTNGTDGVYDPAEGTTAEPGDARTVGLETP